MNEDIVREIKLKYSKIRSGSTIESAMEVLEIDDPHEFEALLTFFEASNLPFEFVEKENGLCIKKPRGYLKNPNIKANHYDLEHTKICVVSDTHFCNKKQQLHLLNKIYERCHNEGITTVLHCGDVVDGDYTMLRRDTIFDLFARGFDQQLYYTLEHYPKVEGIKTYFIQGSHDETHEKNGGAVLGKHLHDRRHDLIYLGQDEADIYLGKNKNIKVKMQHPGGGSSKSLSYKQQENINSFSSGSKPQMFLQGHYHKSNYLFYRNVHAFIVPCLTDQTDFMRKNNLANIVGAYFIDIYSNKKGEIEYISYDEERFEKEDFKDDDYYTTEQLVIKKPKVRSRKKNRSKRRR